MESVSLGHKVLFENYLDEIGIIDNNSVWIIWIKNSYLKVELFMKDYYYLTLETI